MLDSFNAPSETVGALNFEVLKVESPCFQIPLLVKHIFELDSVKFYISWTSMFKDSMKINQLKEMYTKAIIPIEKTEVVEQPAAQQQLQKPLFNI